MKKLLFFALLLFLAACHEEDEDLLYLCDPGINKIVKSAVNEYNQISLSDFLLFDIDFQRAIYRSFSPDKRYDFWLAKLDSAILSNNYNEQEKRHIRNLIAELTPDYFDLAEKDSTRLKMQLDFVSNWTSEARELFHWKTNHVKYLLFFLYVTEDQLLSAISKTSDTTVQSLSTTCNCAVEYDCNDPGCDTSEDCNTQLGCGPLWLTKCTGMCN
jgi:hypothetical protein